MSRPITDRLRRSEEETQTDRERRTIFDRVLVGVVGGVIATTVMTVYRLPISESLPPTAEFWAQYVGSGDAEAYPVVGLALHFMYGIAGGITFAVIAPGSGESDAHSQRKNVVFGTLYGLLLSVFGTRILLERVLGIDVESDYRLIFHVSHVIYGLTLGTWVGSRLGTD
jgi:hypothetical protein